MRSGKPICAPPCLSEVFSKSLLMARVLNTLVTSSRFTFLHDSSTSPLMLRLFQIPSVKTKSSGQRSFAYQGPTAWNKTPAQRQACFFHELFQNCSKEQIPLSFSVVVGQCTIPTREVLSDHCALILRCLFFSSEGFHSSRVQSHNSLIDNNSKGGGEDGGGGGGFGVGGVGVGGWGWGLHR